MKKIPLNGVCGTGQFAIVDDRYGFLSRKKWHMFHGYARTALPKIGNKPPRKREMHLIIMNPPKGMLVDHIDGNRLNNQRDNLRICTPRQNRMNVGKHITTNTSGYVGVYFIRGMWEAKICHEYKLYAIGRFKKKSDAARAYNEAAIKFRGSFARLNVIRGAKRVHT